MGSPYHWLWRYAAYHGYFFVTRGHFVPFWGIFECRDCSILAIGSAAYGWIIMKQLVTKQGYEPGMVNGIGMLGGEFLALITAMTWEGSQPLALMSYPQDRIGLWLMAYLGSWTPVAMGAGCLIALIIIANFIGYNLYGYLLKTYSATLLSFAGFVTPFFAVIFGWVFLFEVPTVPFFLSLGLTISSLYLFYRDEIIF